MSTILKSLRKLEEEKRVHEKKLNLRDLMIRDDRRPPVQSVLNGKPRRWGSGLLLIGTGLAVAIFMFLLMMPTGKTGAPGGEGKIKTVSTDPSPRKAEDQKLAGVPLSSIPDYSSNKTSLEVKGTSEPAPVESTIVDRVDPVPVRVTLAPTTPAVEAASPEKEIEPAQADQEIISAFEQVPEQKRTSMEPNPSIPVIRPHSAEEIIPGLKLKGIVFFDEGSRENYLFFTLPGMSIHRLKVGETVMDAKLIDIHPGLAVFDYQGQRVELRVGS